MKNLLFVAVLLGNMINVSFAHITDCAEQGDSEHYDNLGKFQKAKAIDDIDAKHRRGFKILCIFKKNEFWIHAETLIGAHWDDSKTPNGLFCNIGISRQCSFICKRETC